MRYSLRQLEVFLATARHENISRAADQLSMSQSAASSSLKELESQFAVQLFDRVGKRLQLSELGQQLRPQAEHLLDQAKEFEGALGGESIRGRLEVGATLTIGNYVAVDIIADFQQRYPESAIALHVANTRQIAEEVAGYNLDMGLIEGELQHEDLNIEHWRNDELTVFAHPDHALARKNRLTDQDLEAARWIVRESGSGTRQAFDRAMQGILPDLTIALELQHTEAIKRAVASGLGIGCLSRICLEDAFERGSLCPLEVPHRDFRREWYLISHRKKFHSASLAAWFRLCQQDWSAPPSSAAATV